MEVEELCVINLSTEMHSEITRLPITSFVHIHLEKVEWKNVWVEHVYIFINNTSEHFTLFREHRLRTSAMPIIEVVVIFFMALIIYSLEESFWELLVHLFALPTGMVLNATKKAMQILLLPRRFAAWLWLGLLYEIRPTWRILWSRAHCIGLAFGGNVTSTNICTFVLVHMELRSLYWS